MMSIPPSELAGALYHCQAGVEAVLRQDTDREKRAAGLAELLRELLPGSEWTACLLVGGATSSLVVRSASDSPDPKLISLLRSQIESIDPLALGVQVLPAVAPGGGRILASAIHHEGRPRGFLALGLDGDGSMEEVARAEALLAVCVPSVALRWALETMRDEQAESARFALVGQAFLGLAHELNNLLNSMMLQTSVVQLRVEPQTRKELATIRQHGTQAADLLRSLQYVVQERREKSYAVDLNDTVAEVLEESELRQGVSAEFAPEAPRIQGTRGAVKQFVRLVLQGVRASTKSSLRWWTEKRQEGAALSVEIAATADGASPSAESVLWQNLDEVGRQAGQSLLRQLGGEMTVEQGRDGAMVLRVTWA
jgi:signal transduction histidine kinase